MRSRGAKIMVTCTQESEQWLPTELQFKSEKGAASQALNSRKQHGLISSASASCVDCERAGGFLADPNEGARDIQCPCCFLDEPELLERRLPYTAKLLAVKGIRKRVPPNNSPDCVKSRSIR